jgi:ABC-2 type transport system permease protein
MAAPPEAIAAPTPAKPADWLRRRGPGWIVVMGKEVAEGLTSLRFTILLGLLALAAAGPVYAASGAIRDAAEGASGAAAVFLALFTIGAEPVPSFVALVGFLAPLLGIAFGFDAINGERAQGTLPRLLSQPIHRDDVINGKFVAGLTVITVILISVVGIVASVGMLRLGVLPTAEDVLRLMLWLILTIAYIGFWLALALLCSVLLRRAATSALTALAVWLVLSLFLTLVVTLVAGFVRPYAPDAGTSSPEYLSNLQLQTTLRTLAPNQAYDDATALLLNPRLRTVTPIDLLTPAQRSGAIGGLVSLEQSLLIIWPQFVGLIALTAGSFAVAYVAFMRQEVRA